MLGRLTSRRAPGKGAALLALAALGVLAPLAARGSGATFVASASSPGATFVAAADFNTVHVALDDPGTPRTALHLTATATSDRGITSVRFERSAHSFNEWTEICTDTTAPYECTLSADGVYDLRATARDAAGYERTDAVADRRVDGTAPTVTLADPGSALHGTVRLTSTASDAGSGLSRFTLEYQHASGAWQEVCHAAGACDWNTATLPDGDYELRATAEDAAGNRNEVSRSGLHVDNAAPTVAVAPIAPQVTGMITLSASVTDTGGSGIKSVVYEGRPTGTSTWYEFCRRTSAPWDCQGLDTTMAPDGTYDGRVVVTDNAGNAMPSESQAINVDNHAPTVTFTDPGTPLKGTVTLTATAGDGQGSGVASVVFQRAPAGTTTWTTLCTGTAVGCAWATTTVADGLWDLRVVVTDRVGKTTTVTRGNRRVDNTPPAAVSVQGANGGVAGTLDAADAFTFTYSEAMAPATILAGWSGTQSPVSVRISNDTLAVYDAAKSTSLGLDVALGADVVDADAWFDATITVANAQITVTLTALSAGAVKPAGGTPQLTWTPSTAARDLAGNACSATPATETGPVDQDF